MRTSVKRISLSMIAAVFLWTAVYGAPESGATLDAAIADAGAYCIGGLLKGTKVAIVGIEAPTQKLSDYMFEELWNQFEHTGKFVMVDRRNLERIRGEMRYQLSGDVSDESILSLGHQYGAQYLIHGQLSAFGSEYRLTVYATDVEKAVSSQRTVAVRSDSRLAFLLTAALDEQIEWAMAAMARQVQQRTTIAVGRIVYGDTQSVSNLSGYLKNAITAAAHRRHGETFIVAGDRESADLAVKTLGLRAEVSPGVTTIQAVVTGTFSPVDKDVKVSLRLVSTAGDGLMLGSADFIVSAVELERRKLSPLPVKDTAVISKPDFDAKQKALEPYSGKNNRFIFSVSPDDLDGIYADGEFMTMRLYSERECYFRITHVDVNGTVQVIYPTVPSDNNRIKAGEIRQIPDNTRFRMVSPYGEEYILVAAYDAPFTVRPEPETPVSAAARFSSGAGESAGEYSPRWRPGSYPP